MPTVAAQRGSVTRKDIVTAVLPVRTTRHRPRRSILNVNRYLMYGWVTPIAPPWGPRARMERRIWLRVSPLTRNRATVTPPPK